MRARQVLIAIDQLFNAVFNGWADETLSCRAYRWELNGKRSWPRKLIDSLFFWQKAHCKSSWQNERERRHLPPEMR
jgi:hypothetical protein